MSESLPNGWVRASLEEVADVRDFEREPINSSDRENRINGKSESELYPYFGATGQVGFIDSFRSEGQRILLGEDAAPFLDPVKEKAYLVNGRFWVNNHAHVLAGAVGLIDNKFLCHQLNTVDYHPFVSGSTRLKLTSSAMKQIPMVVAPATEQTRIVAKLEELLSDLDAGVAELKAAQKKLAQYRQSLLKAAVEGALTAAWRTQHQPTETGAQLLQRILQERRARWEARQLARFAEQGKTPPKDWQKKYPEPVQPDTSGLPELPQGWVWATAEMLFSWGSGDFLPASAQIDGDYPVYGGNGINGRHNAANVGHATIVIGRVGAHCGNVFRTESAAWVTDNAIYATAKNEFITWAHSELTMQAANLGSGSKGGAQPFISQKILNDTFIALPPIREQERILEEYVVALNSNEEMAASIAISLQQSTAQRQNILRAAFSGQLVPQDPHDEPASVLLERIRAERAAQGAVKKPRGRKAKEAA